MSKSLNKIKKQSAVFLQRGEGLPAPGMPAHKYSDLGQIAQRLRMPPRILSLPLTPPKPTRAKPAFGKGKPKKDGMSVLSPRNMPAAVRRGEGAAGTRRELSKPNKVTKHFKKKKN